MAFTEEIGGEERRMKRMGEGGESRGKKRGKDCGFGDLTPITTLSSSHP